MSIVAVIALMLASVFEGEGQDRESPAVPILVSFSVADLEQSERFYTEVMGFRQVSKHAFDDLDMVFLRLGSFELELIEKDGAATWDRPENPADRLGFGKIAFRSDHLDRLYERSAASGATIVSDIGFSRRVDMRFFIVADPDGNWVQIYGD